ncbi:hypothetical protein DPX16_11843 [Anabarilius grahami]|uniref:Uncharacterized protein n=1 Tax=Anabarilius grahami TaxID=495550 RepID=A0A3N0Z9P4_ANAGA|nr:hypothetical protein DPX16_11843 [Anabarilius grahami]
MEADCDNGQFQTLSAGYIANRCRQVTADERFPPPSPPSIARNSRENLRGGEQGQEDRWEEGLTSPPQTLPNKTQTHSSVSLSQCSHLNMITLAAEMLALVQTLYKTNADILENEKAPWPHKSDLDRQSEQGLSDFSREEIEAFNRVKLQSNTLVKSALSSFRISVKI